MLPGTHRIFLSYARRDANIVHEVYVLLKSSADIAVWYDKQNIVPAKDWDPQIKAGLDSCDSLLLIASRYSLSSEAVKRELSYFLAQNKPVYVALIDHTPIDPDIAHCPLADFRADPLDMNHWLTFIQALRTNHLTYTGQDVSQPVRPAYVQAFLSRTGRLNLGYAGLGVLLLALLPQNISWWLFMVFLWMPDVSLSLWMRRLLAARRLQEKRLNLLFIQVFLRVVLLALILNGLVSGIFPGFSDPPQFLSPEGVLGSATALVAFVVAIYMTGNLYRRAFADVFAPYRYRYANTDISRRLIQQWGSDASVAAFNTAAYRFFAMNVIFDSKLVGWLPAYPVEWSFRVRFFPKNTHYQDMESVTAPPISQTITILHDRRDLHLADFLKEPLRAAYPVETESLTDTFHEGGMPTGTYIPIITPYSVRAVNAFCEQYPQVRCIPVVMQKTKLPPLLNKIQYVDSRDDYRTAAQSIQKILDGVQTSRVTGEVEDRRRFFIPRSVLVLFAPSLFMLFGLLMILILGAVFAASPQAIPDADYEPAFYIGLAVVVLPVMVVPLLTIINGVRRRYSLSTLAILNILMMLPGVLLLLSTLTSPDMLCGLPILGAILIIPPGLTALLAWTDVDFGEWFGHEPASPRIWAPHKGLSWGILAYMALLMAGGVALFISTLPQ